MLNSQGGSFQENSSSSSYQRPAFQGAYNALSDPHPTQHHMAQSHPLSNYNDLDKVNDKVNDMERMIREVKESNERMTKIISEQFHN